MGMLVKQWLLEYLAMDTISPRAQLRVWRYRSPALEKWKVFEIAAVLPLLLQVSLGLFFIGLCVFTATVDERMGHFSIPLILAWAFFVIMTTIAPLISPRCPFKVPLLNAVMKIGRRYIKFLSGLLLRVQLRDEEENVIQKFGESDVQILLSVDELLSDDGLPDIMWEALQQGGPSSEEIFAFARGILEHRLRQVSEISLAASHRRFTLDLRLVSKRIWDMCTEIIFLTLTKYQSSHADRRHSQWTTDAFRLLLSKRAYPFPPSVISILTNDVTLENVLGALLDSSLAPDEAMEFLCVAAHARAPSSPDRTLNISTPMWWQTVKHSALSSTWTPMLGIMQRTLNSHLEMWPGQISHPWVVDAVLVLLANPPFVGRSNLDPSALQRFLATPSLTALADSDVNIITVGRLLADRIRPNPGAVFIPISPGLLFAVQRPDSHSRLRLLNVSHMYSILLDYEAGREPLQQLPRSMWTFVTDAGGLFENKRVQVILEDAWTFFHRYVSRCIDDPATVPPTGLRGAFRVILEFSVLDSRKKGNALQLWRRLATCTLPPMRRLWLTMLFPIRQSSKNIVDIDEPTIRRFVTEVFNISENLDVVTRA